MTVHMLQTVVYMMFKGNRIEGGQYYSMNTVCMIHLCNGMSRVNAQTNTDSHKCQVRIGSVADPGCLSRLQIRNLFKIKW
jgi:hypothetical protein